ncbi:uncharacterized protein [Onthophagus taurus]|uniref:uncharacterized protein n=1 Tax=Onthophagus taurus TaxID=166361 RepID=UPI0039BDBD96
MFVQAEKGINTWSTLKRRLIEEFEVKVSSAQVHKLLMNKKKELEETVREYVLVMREIGSKTRIEDEVIIQYIIDGIPDKNNKVKLYEEIKAKKNLEHHRNKTQDKKNFKKTNEKDLKSDHNEGQQVCFNYGIKGHKANACPDKNKGTKCFKCNRFRHISTKCKSNNKDRLNVGSTKHSVNVVEVVEENILKFNIDNIVMKALLDTGSDINAIREDIFQKYFSMINLEETSIAVKGLGGRQLCTLGSFSRNAIINDEEYQLKFRVLPRQAITRGAIIGRELLSKSNVTFRDGQIIIFKKEDSNFLMEIVTNEYNEEEIEVEHVENKEIRMKDSELIQEYEPKKTKPADISMKIIMKTEEPIYQRPRMLDVVGRNG